MNISELMIGDWVAIKILSQIPTYEKKQWSAKDYSHNYNIEAIPLTEHILEINGFKKHESNYLKYFVIDIKKTHIEITKKHISIWYDYNEHNDGIYSDITIPRVDNVHEFQHILHICKLDNFANNFKID